MSRMKPVSFVFGFEPDWIGALYDCSSNGWPRSGIGYLRTYGIYSRDYSPLFIGGVCPVCQAASNTASMSRCANCLMVRYCSREHQRQHWPDHRTFCDWVAPAGRCRFTCGAGIRDHGKWLTLQSDLMESFARQNPGVMQRLGTMYFFSAPVCALCHSPKASVECSLCCSTFYCCLEHLVEDAERHMKACGHLKLIVLRDQHIEKYGGFVLPPVLSRPATIYTPLTGTIHSVIDNQLNDLRFFEKAESSDQIVPLAILKSLLSEPLTVLHALQECKRLPLISERTSLTIHYIHKDDEPFFKLTVLWEDLLHRLPRLQQLRLVYVLLGQPDDQHLSVLQTVEHLPCKDCQQRNRRVIREHALALHISEVPDIVFWPKSVKHDPHPAFQLRLPNCCDVPVLLTCSNTAVVSKMMDILAKVGVVSSLTALMDLQVNPFHGAMPFPDPSRLSVHEDAALSMQYMMVLCCRGVIVVDD